MEGLIKGGLSLLVYFLIYTLFIRKTKKPSPKPPAPPIAKSIKTAKAAPLLSIAKEPVKWEKKPLLSEITEANPLYVPSHHNSRIRTLIRGQSKRKAILLSEVLKNPYL